MKFPQIIQNLMNMPRNIMREVINFLLVLKMEYSLLSYLHVSLPHGLVFFLFLLGQIEHHILVHFTSLRLRYRLPELLKKFVGQSTEKQYQYYIIILILYIQIHFHMLLYIHHIITMQLVTPKLHINETKNIFIYPHGHIFH